MIDVISTYGLEALGRFYSRYRGIVIENDDPKDMHRISVVVPEVSELPIWALPLNDGAMDSGYKWLPPKKGQMVYVEYEKGDPNFPIWSYHSWAKNEVPRELIGESKFGFVTPGGNKVIVDDDTGEVTISMKNGKDDSVITLSKGVLTLLGKNDEGVPLASAITKKLNALETEVNNLKTALNASAAAISVMFPPYATVQTWSAAPPIVKTVKSDLENKNIKQ